MSSDPQLQPFYSYSPAHPDFDAIIQDKAQDQIDRKMLAQVIERQYQGLELGEKVKENIRRLARPDSFTITTGHQLVLFGGPMFTVYKVISVIRLAEQLSEAGHTVVPVFWIHTEDHDFEEINHYYRDFSTKLTYPGSFETMVGSHVLEPSILDLLPRYLPESLNAHFRPGVRLADAFRSFFHELFREYGLLMLDASDPALKQQFTRVLVQELESSFSSEAILAANEQLETAGYKVQIHPRDINLFYLDEDGRNRIVEDNGRFHVLDRDLSFSKDEILRLAASQPELFSPNVSLRPLYQEMILPNLAYIGGWGELSYWLQLKGVFEAADINFPLVLPRMSVTMFSAEQAREWESFGLELPQIQQPVHELFHAYLPQVWDASVFESYESKILALMDALEGYVKEEVSETLARSADALSTKTRHFLENLEKKAGKIIRQQHHEPFDQIRDLKNRIQPDGLVQERVLSLESFASLISPQDLIRFLYQGCNPLNPSPLFRVLPVR